MKCMMHGSNNMLLGAPKDMPNCETVPATMFPDGQDGPMIATFWKPSPEELEQINANGFIVLWVWGNAHPPVGLSTHLDQPL